MVSLINISQAIKANGFVFVSGQCGFLPEVLLDNNNIDLFRLVNLLHKMSLDKLNKC